MTVFLDWLTIHQEHVECPIWGSTRHVEVDIDTDELLYQVIRGQQVEGSWATGLRVRSDGSRVEVSGNPSKFGRLDNLLGVSTMAEALVIYNDVLRQLGLPPFELSCLADVVGATGAGSAGAGIRKIRKGPVITAVHVTRNLIAGTAQGAIAFLDWMTGQTWGRLPFNHHNETTVQAGRLDRRQWQMYLKGPELLEHAGKWRRARAVDTEDKDYATGYLTDLARWCNENGVVRDELKLGRKWLQESNFRYPENWQDDTVPQLHKDNCEVATMNVGAMSDYGSEVYNRLVAGGIGPRTAEHMKNAVSSWLSGQSWGDTLGRARRYEYLKALRDHCGLDLRKPAKVRVLATCIKPKVLEMRELQPSDLPDWYDGPQQRVQPARGVVVPFPRKVA